MKIAVSGSRGVVIGTDLLARLMSYLTPLSEVTILTGDCVRGADLAARKLAACRNRPIQVFEADWEEHGKSAGPIRNRAMIEEADALVAVWDGKSRGTGGTIELARRKGIPVLLWEVPIDVS